MPTTPLLDIKDLTVSFTTDRKQLVALSGIDLQVTPGRTLCLVGESGCGKSVTARAILRILADNAQIDSGEINFARTDGATTDLAAIDPQSRAMRALRGDEIAMIYQEPMTALSPLYSIGDQIVEALKWHRSISDKDARAAAIKTLESVGMPAPEKRFDSYSFELSGGQRQRAMIAMALVCHPRLLIADEPTTALDVTTQAVILDLLRDLQAREQMSMLFITHDLGVVAEIADDVAVMYMGTVVEAGPVEQILSDPRHPYTRGLIAALPGVDTRRTATLHAIPGAVPGLNNRPAGCPFASRCSHAVPGLCDVDEAAMYDLGKGHKARCHLLAETGHLPSRVDAAASEALAHPEPDYSAQPILRLRAVEKTFSVSNGMFRKPTEIRALNGVSFDLWPGETLGLVGESGCGKSTLGQAILGLTPPDSGQVALSTDTGPVDLATTSPRALKRHWRDLRMVFQDPNGSFNPRLTVFDIIADVLRMGGGTSKAEITARVADVLGMVGLDAAHMDRYAHAFSGGQRQRIGIARALAPQPRIVIADEPVSALDVSVQAQVLNLLKALQAELGLTYLFISHDLSVVYHISDRVAVMFAGEIVEIAPTQALFDAPRHPYTHALLASVLEPVPRSMRTSSRKRLPGSVPDPANLPTGCKFRPRCAFASERCAHEAPRLDATGRDHDVACFHPLNGGDAAGAAPAPQTHDEEMAPWQE